MLPKQELLEEILFAKGPRFKTTAHMVYDEVYNKINADYLLAGVNKQESNYRANEVATSYVRDYIHGFIDYPLKVDELW